ncbi:MAG TPA: hypothetical protein VF747_01835 [Blastocatellia bacterium]|jgi:hypothetical protein
MRNALSRSILLAVAITLPACESGTKIIEPPPHATAGNEIAAMARLKAIAMAEMHYQIESGGKYGSLDELIQKGLVNDPSQGKLTGYKFDLLVRGNGFQATAAPERFGVTGKRSFYIDERNVMRGADKGGAQATASDPEV